MIPYQPPSSPPIEMKIQSPLEKALADKAKFMQIKRKYGFEKKPAPPKMQWMGENQS